MLLEGDELQLTLPRRVLFLRDFLLGYLAANGGEARVEDIEAALKRAKEKRNVIIAGGTRDLRAELEVLAAAGLLEQNDGSVRLHVDKLSPLVKRKVEKVAKLIAAMA
ncbi:hypothetical protein Pyrfu_0879 [Pyrolobus fumarii 1A]|uniref:Uncharacterized protein n=2 Tax=Pyrolobus fumarii TaxID=54252 RepID=G0EE54_PYRF1|nr:hypothetical protein Pyrfu_0879 [Pyrolobus fumarii 1A]